MRWITKDKTDSNLLKLLEEAKSHVMTKEERRAQKISWVAGEIGMDYPELSMEECRERAIRAIDGDY